MLQLTHLFDLKFSSSIQPIFLIKFLTINSIPLKLHTILLMHFAETKAEIENKTEKWTGKWFPRTPQIIESDEHICNYFNYFFFNFFYLNYNCTRSASDLKSKCNIRTQLFKINKNYFLFQLKMRIHGLENGSLIHLVLCQLSQMPTL